MRNVLRKVNKQERKVFGVCGGISRYLDPELDPIIIRLTYLILSLFNPALIVVYIILAIVLKKHDTPTMPVDIVANFQKNCECKNNKAEDGKEKGV